MAETLGAVCSAYLQVLEDFPASGETPQGTARFLETFGDLMVYDFGSRFAFLEACRIVMDQTPQRWDSRYAADVRATQQELYFTSMVGLVDLEAKLHQHPEVGTDTVEQARCECLAVVAQLVVAVNEYWGRWMELQSRSTP